MKSLKNRPPVAVVWLILTGITLISWWLGVEHSIGSLRLAGVIILILAFIKVRLVGIHFIELRAAPRRLRALFDGYCVVVCSLVVGLYVVSW